MNNEPKNDIFLTIEEVAKMLRVADATVYRMVRSGKLPAIKFGKVWRIKKEELRKIIGDF